MQKSEKTKITLKEYLQVWGGKKAQREKKLQKNPEIRIRTVKSLDIKRYDLKKIDEKLLKPPVQSPNSSFVSNGSINSLVDINPILIIKK